MTEEERNLLREVDRCNAVMGAALNKLILSTLDPDIVNSVDCIVEFNNYICKHLTDLYSKKAS